MSQSTLEKRQAPSTPTIEELRELVGYAVLAPSGGNMQPWRFRWRDDQLFCFIDPARGSFLDYASTASYAAIGAAVENLTLTAARLGLAVEVMCPPPTDEPHLVAVVRFVGRVAPETLPLFAQITQRATNRRLGERRLLRPADVAALHAALVPQTRLHLCETLEELAKAADVLGAADRVIYSTSSLSRGLLEELRWTHEHAERTRDGVDVATLEVAASQRTMLKLLYSWPGLTSAFRMMNGRGLDAPIRAAIQAASALASVTVAGRDVAAFFQGGRAMQRVWLAATGLGVAVQPHSMLPYLFARLEDGGEGIDSATQAKLRALLPRYREVFPLPAGHSEVLLVRLTYAPAPSTRALRRPIDDVLQIA